MKDNPYVSRVTTAVIPATDGTQTLSATFGDRLYLGPGCEKLGNYTSLPTEQRGMEFLPLVKDGTSSEIFEGFGVPLKQLALTPAQFCAGKEFFQRGNLVLIQVEARGVILFFVANVYFDGGGSLDVRVRKFSHNRVWHAGSRRHVVVLQQEPVVT